MISIRMSVCLVKGVYESRGLNGLNKLSDDEALPPGTTRKHNRNNASDSDGSNSTDSEDFDTDDSEFWDKHLGKCSHVVCI